MLSIEFLRECFVLQPDGRVRWRARPSHHFDSPAIAKMWNTRFAGTTAGTPARAGHLAISLRIDGEKVAIRAHVVAWAITHGEWPTSLIDHRDRVATNNAPDNLRPATTFQNAQNHGLRRDNTSGHKGVVWYPSREQWLVRITANGRRRHLGYFDLLADAIAAYEKAALELHGEFAALTARPQASMALRSEAVDSAAPASSS